MWIFYPKKTTAWKSPSRYSRRRFSATLKLVCVDLLRKEREGKRLQGTNTYPTFGIRKTHHSSTQEISQKDPLNGVPEAKYLIARSQLTERGPLGFGPMQFLMESKLSSFWGDMLVSGSVTGRGQSPYIIIKGCFLFSQLHEPRE